MKLKMPIKNLFLRLLILILFYYAEVFSQYTSENVTLISRLGDGRNYGMFIESNIAYIGGGSYLYIMDVSDILNPKLISKTLTTNVVGEIKKRDNILFIAHGADGLSIFDVSDRVNPQFIGNCRPKSYCNELTIYNNYVFLSDVEYGLIVIDISDITNPVEVSSYYSDGWAEATEIKGNLLYYCDNYAGLKIFDISVPTNPILLKKYTNLQSAENIIFYKNFDIVLSQYGELYILNSTNIDNITEVSKLEINGANRQIFLDRDTLYINSLYSKINAVDISDITNPQIVFTYDLNIYTSSVESIGNNLFVLNADTGLEIYDKKFSNKILSNYLLPSYLREFAFYNDNIAIAYQFSGVRLFDISNPQKPEFIRNIYSNTYPLNIYSQMVSNVITIDNIAFIFSENNGIHLVDIQDQNNSVFLTKLLDDSGNLFRGSGVSKINDSIYYVVGSNKVYIYNFLEFNHPILKNTFDVQYPQRIISKDNFAYITNSNLQDDFYLTIFNIENPLHPIQVGNIRIGYQLYGIDIKDNYIFAACQNGGLYIIDISDKTMPIVKEIIYYGNHFMSYVSIDQNYAYVTDGINGLLVFDISDIKNIAKVGSINFNTSTYYVKAYKNKVYISSFYTGLYVVSNDLITDLFENKNDYVVQSVNLLQNFPNPFNPSTTIKFQLSQKEFVNLEIYNNLGERITILINNEMESGNHAVKFDGSLLPSGIYFYRISTKSGSISKAMNLIK
jgi:hypothetical protein